MTPTGLPELEARRILADVLLPKWITGAVPQQRPVVVVVAGPPGSGKSTAADMIHNVLNCRGGAVRIASDLYKQAHREYQTVLERDVRTAGAAVRAATRWWQAEIEAYARAAALDVVVELALADPAEARAVAALYRPAGYRIELVALAVPEADSQLGVLARYFGPEGRYVAWDTQDRCADGLLATLAVVEAEKLADRVTVVRRGMEPVYGNELTADGAWARPPAAAGAVRAERLRPWDAPRTRRFQRALVRAEVLVHDERLPADRRLAVSRDAERAAAAAEPVRRIAQPIAGPPGTGYHRLGAEQHRWVFDELIAPTYLDRPLRRSAAPHRDPVVLYLVGEPGAGHLLASRMLRRAMRPGTVRLDPETLRGAHPDSFELVNTTPRLADDAVRPDADAWQAEAEAYVRERRGDLLIEPDFTDADGFALSTSRFARAGYQVEVVALAGRDADSRQRTLVDYARALELDITTPLPTAAAHARACRVAENIVAAAAADPRVRAVRVIDGDHRERGRDRWAAWAWAAARRRPYSDGEAARFHSVQRALHRVLPRFREEINGITLQAQPLMPAAWRARAVEHQAVPGALPLPTAGSIRCR
ncbi:zeta toxin family protein [Streptomyces sp. NPDC089919]|uniref:zeta toxin family protein n=1 Tax=Streptomyces sp. NPDC089919 TaxID=3155188 RepID=UPI003415792A